MQSCEVLSCFTVGSLKEGLLKTSVDAQQLVTSTAALLAGQQHAAFMVLPEHKVFVSSLTLSLSSTDLRWGTPKAQNLLLGRRRRLLRRLPGDCVHGHAANGPCHQRVPLHCQHPLRPPHLQHNT